MAIAQEVLDVLQSLGSSSGYEYSTLASIQQGVHANLDWASDLDIEYVLNVLSRPTELKFLHGEESRHTHVVGDKDTALVEKAAHVVEFRISRLGKSALAMASDNMDIAYIEGDVTKLIRALDAGRLAPALGFIERLLMQLKNEQLALMALIEKTSGGRKSRMDAMANLELYRETMRRSVKLIEEASIKVGRLATRDASIDDDVPMGLIKAKLKELSAGVVRYGRELTRLAELSMHGAQSSVQAPSFLDLAQQWVKTPPASNQIDWILSMLGPAIARGVMPTGTDFSALIKARVQQAAITKNIKIDEFDAPLEDRFLEWLSLNQPALEKKIQNGGIDLIQTLREGMGELNHGAVLNCLVTALTAPDEWVNEPVEVMFDRSFARSHLPGLEALTSSLTLKRAPNEAREDS